MPADELDREIEAGVGFWGYEADGELVGVMGIQDVGDVDLIRHAYVAPGEPAARHRRRAARAAGRGSIERPMLVGTWAAAEWAIRFYERHGFELVSAGARRRAAQRPTGRFPTARSRRRWCSEVLAG